jgi:beta-galactosidase GanA
MIPEARDHSREADAAYAAPAPAELLQKLKSDEQQLAPEFRDLWKKTNNAASGNWQTCFGEGAASEEAFMAWHFARYVDRVAAAGKAEYPLPMFVNGALIRPEAKPGEYPSAGPLPHLADIWHAAAPHIDFLAPDVYFPNFVEWIDKYARGTGPLFIPEARMTDQNAANALYAIGAHGAIGFSPFSIESVENPSGDALQQVYSILKELAPLIAAHRGKPTMAGFAPHVPFDESAAPSSDSVELGGYSLTVKYETADMWAPPKNPPAPPKASGGIIIATGPDEFLIAGTGLVATFPPRATAPRQTGIVSAQEGRFKDGQWIPDRWLNGDQTHQGRHIRIPAGTWGMQKFTLYRYD